MEPEGPENPSTHKSHFEPFLANGLGGEADEEQTKKRVEAWGVLFLRYRRLVWKWCRARLSEADAEDVTQTLMSELPKRLRGYKPRDDNGKRQPFRNWLKVVVRHLIIDAERKTARDPGARGQGGDEHHEALAALGEAADELIDTIDTETRAEWTRRVDEVCAGMTPENGAAFRAWLGGQKPSAIAAEQGRPVARVHQAVHRGMKKLEETADPGTHGREQ